MKKENALLLLPFLALILIFLSRMLAKLFWLLNGFALIFLVVGVFLILRQKKSKTSYKVEPTADKKRSQKTVEKEAWSDLFEDEK